MYITYDIFKGKIKMSLSLPIKKVAKDNKNQCFTYMMQNEIRSLKVSKKKQNNQTIINTSFDTET